jgi:Tfp pilus assembly protein PilF
LGTVHLIRNKAGDAEKAYRRAIEARPAFGLALLNLGRFLASQKKFEEAVEHLTRAVELQPQSAEANLLVGEAYLQLKKGSKAVGYLNEAMRLDPIGKAGAHLRLAALYNAAGMKDKAALEYEQSLTKKPDYAEREKLQQYIKDNKRP